MLEMLNLAENKIFFNEMFKICQMYKFHYRVRDLLDGKFLMRC